MKKNFNFNCNFKWQVIIFLVVTVLVSFTHKTYAKGELKLFFGGIENKSSYDSPSFFSNTAKKLKIAFADTGRFAIVKDIDKADLILNAQVLEVKIGDNPQDIKFALKSVFLSKKNEPIWEGSVSVGNEKIGYEGKIENLIEEIVQKACSKLAEQASLSVIFRANVQMVSGGDIIIDAGKDSGLIKDTVLEVLNDKDKIVAKAKVTGVYLTSARAQLFGNTSLESIAMGDKVKIFSFPSQVIAGKKITKGKNKFFKSALITLGVAVGAAIIIGNQKSKAPAQETTTTTVNTTTGLPTTPAASIQLTTNPTTITADGSSMTTITALVSDVNKATVGDGTQVTFKTDNGTLSQIGGGAITTTTNGIATINLVSSTTVGTATVSATADTASASTTVSFTVVSSPPASINLSIDSNPVSISSSGVNIGTAKTNVTATVLDASGNNVADGTSVTFTTTLGSINGLATTTSGKAVVSFTSTQTGIATITATSSSITQTANLTVNPGPPYMIDVVANPVSIEANGQSFSTITVTLRDISGNLVTDGTEIDFGDGATLGVAKTDANSGGNGSITTKSYTTSGIAKAVLVSKDSNGSPSKSGTATIVATVPTTQPANIPAPASTLDNSSQPPTKVTFVSKIATYISASSRDFNLRGLDWIANTTTITALVYDVNHNPVPDGTAVYFYADHGMIEGDGATVGNVATSTTTSGVATATIATAGSNSEAGYNPAMNLVTSAGPWNWDGNVHVSIVSGNASYNLDKASTTLIFTGPTNVNYSTVFVSSSGGSDTDTIASIIAGATSNCGNMANKGDACTITLVLHDINNKYIVDNTAITFEANKGTMTASPVNTGGGVATSTLKTAALTEDQATASGPGTVTITIPTATSSSIVFVVNFNVL